jgi:hypothetical protein
VGLFASHVGHGDRLGGAVLNTGRRLSATSSDESGAVAPRSSLPERAARRPDGGEGGEPEPTIVVYGFEDSVAALTAAARLGQPVRLKSPFVVAAALGPQVAWSMFRQASAAVPEAVAIWVLDCGDETGTALAALRLGVPELQLAAPGEARARVADIARQLGARVAEDAEGTPILDLADADEPLAACREWLESLRNRSDPRRKPHCQGQTGRVSDIGLFRGKWGDGDEDCGERQEGSGQLRER